ncbi:MAG: HTH-type transcriptional activator mta [Candidatus Dichloromethanomonas elyunquensis]|nr:MAG: HTH-type transcriptional activator mta [Candidatus Dichloromethanomonas elyunquensis]
MEYSINKLAKLAGVSTRTLRYYDEIGLLSPERISNNDYRVYGQKEVDLLQQILFYRELGVSLDEIKNIVWSKDYNGIAALQGHLSALKAKKEQIELLITNVEKTIAASKGEITMSNKEKFEGFKQKMLDENEKQYGKEIREKFGDAIVDASNAKMMGLTAEQYEKVQNLSCQINELLKTAFEQGDPSSELAQKVCALHKEWLGYFWDHYSKEAHLGLAQGYVDDPRFRKYYDAVATGCAEFLRDAIKIYCE